MAKIKPSPVIVRSTDTELMRHALAAATPPPHEAGPGLLTQQPSPGGLQTVVVPVSKVRENPFNARVFYTTDDIDSMSMSLSAHGQEVPASGYLEGDYVVLLDGQKRLRGAKSAGLDFFRVEICEKPKSVKEMYLTSRRINKERSGQGVLDDAIRFKALLGTEDFPTQQSLADSVGVSQSIVSRTITLNQIPERVMRRIIDTPLFDQLDALYALSQLFSEKEVGLQIDQAEDLAIEIIDESVKKRLSGKQTIAIINARLAGPRRRDRNDVRYVSMGGARGVLKTNTAKGRLDFSIKGIAAERVESLREQIEAFCSGDAHEITPPAHRDVPPHA